MDYVNDSYDPFPIFMPKSGGYHMLKRPRRNRKCHAIREMVQETRLHPSDFIAPYFVKEGTGKKEPILSLPGVSRLSIDLLLKEAEALLKLGIPAMALFPVIPQEQKDITGTQALNPEGLLQRAIRALKKEFPEMCVIADIALDPYTSHGHDGLVNDKGEILNDETVEVLGKMAIVQAGAGVDIVAPSDMMDGRIRHIRQSLDKFNCEHVSIMAYTAKYASSFYGPFRDALNVKLAFGDKKTYQINPANATEAIREATLDEEEGADFLMVKPALPYLDIISKLRAHTTLPVAAYHVSGEYAMIMAAAQNKWLDPKKAMLECLMGIKRAGADVILTYAARQAAEWLLEE